MANGGDSNSVEVQQTTQSQTTPASDLAEIKLQQERQKAEEMRKVQSLKLTRARVCDQLARSSNERYTAMLNSELEQIDAELTKLG
jgi:peroxiredoxin